MRTRTLDAPAPDEARALVDDDDDSLVTLYGRCEVDYEGRATSYLGPGDRLVVLKPDGTLLVHTDEQRTPVNWQPPGCDHTATVHEGRLRVVSTRETPEETLTVDFDRVFHLTAMGMADEAELALDGTEADLKRRILDDPTIVEPGFVPEGDEVPSSAGPMDVFGHDDEGTPVVLELKRRRVGPDAVGQLNRYVEALEREGEEDVRGILVAPSVTERAADLLDEAGLEHRSIGPDD